MQPDARDPVCITAMLNAARAWRLAETHIASLIPMLETVLRELGVADES